jgi:hypothetical protein
LAAAARGDELPTATAETSGIRKVASSPEAAPRKNALASAWHTATSLLKRFTTRDEGSSPKAAATEALPPVASPAAEEPPASDRLSVWLDSTELEDVASQRAPAPPPPPRKSSAARHAKPSKAKKKPEKKAKKPKKAKAAGKSKKSRKRSKKSG